MPAIAAENAITIHNLLAAFEGESNAHAKYTAFAAKADEDELRGAASLLDFLDAERSYRATQLAYRQALSTYMLAFEQLREVVGTRKLQ